MKTLTTTLAITLAALPTSVEARDAGSFATWSQCHAALQKVLNSDWKTSRDSLGKGSGFGVPFYDMAFRCVRIGDSWIIAPVD